MSLFHLNNERLELTISTHGGTILKLDAKTNRGRVPLLRPSVIDGSTAALQSGCFPLLPFANRVNGNCFSFAGKTYQLETDTHSSSHYLHGDGWLNEWSFIGKSGQQIVLEHEQLDGIYQYCARQTFTIHHSILEIKLELTNLGCEAMPFGLGWRTYLPKTSDTTLLAPASGYWLKGGNQQIGNIYSTLPAELDFNMPNILPNKSVNNGFSGWSGRAKIEWLKEHVQLALHTEPSCQDYFIHIPEAHENPDFFCFDVMSHVVNGHNMPDSGGLTVLEPQQSTQLTLRFVTTSS